MRLLNVRPAVILRLLLLGLFQMPAALIADPLLTSPTGPSPSVSLENSSLVATAPVQIDDGFSTSTLVVTLLDADGNGVANQMVYLSAAGGSSVIYPFSGITDDFGSVSFSVTDSVPETVVYSATTWGGSISSTASVVFATQVDGMPTTCSANDFSSDIQGILNWVFLDPTSTGTDTSTGTGTSSSTNTSIGTGTLTATDASVSIGTLSATDTSLGTGTLTSTDTSVGTGTLSATDTSVSTGTLTSPSTSVDTGTSI
jgi:hypothetical protein